MCWLLSDKADTESWLNWIREAHSIRACWDLFDMHSDQLNRDCSRDCPMVRSSSASKWCITLGELPIHFFVLLVIDFKIVVGVQEIWMHGRRRAVSKNTHTEWEIEKKTTYKSADASKLKGDKRYYNWMEMPELICAQSTVHLNTKADSAVWRMVGSKCE